VLLEKMRARMNGGVDVDRSSATGLRNILTLLRSMRGLVNWEEIVRRLRGEQTTTPSTVAGSTAEMTGSGEWIWDGRTGRWIRIQISGRAPSGPTGFGTGANLLNIGGTATTSDWHFNAQT
ncbi:hypothetical protein MAR_036064, partial [Mya arenaria]